MKTIKGEVKKAYQDLLIFESVVKNFDSLTADLGNTPELEKAKYAVKKVSKLNASHLDEYQDKLTELRIDNAGTDQDGFLAVDEKGNYKYTKEGSKKFNSAVKKLRNKEINIASHIVVIPDGMNKELVELLTGFIFS